MNLEFLPEARNEFAAAVEFYENKEPGLGQRFANEIRDVCSTIVAHPLLWREREGGFRRVNCPIFPYYIAYFTRSHTIFVAAVAHESRHPNYWEIRIR